MKPPWPELAEISAFKAIVVERKIEMIIAINIRAETDVKGFVLLSSNS